MRLPSRGLLVGIGLALAAGVFAQAPAPKPTPSGPVVGGGKAVKMQQQEPRSVTRVEPPPPVVSSETAPQPVGYESDIYCFGYMGDLNETFPVEVHSAEN